MTGEKFTDFPTAIWTVDGGRPIRFSVASIRTSTRNRLVHHRIPYLKGEKLDTTGPDAKTFEITSLFRSWSLGTEKGVDQSQLYPTQANRMEASFDAMATGTLVVPTHGVRRCKAFTCERVEDATVRDACNMTLVWVEDSEESAKKQQKEPGAKSNGQRLTLSFVDSASDHGAMDEDLNSLEEFATSLVGMANAPFEYVEDIERSASRYRSAVERIVGAFTGAGRRVAEDGGNLLTDPGASHAGLLAGRLLDSMAGIVGESRDVERDRRVVTRSFSYPLSIFDVAATVRQNASELSVLNHRLPDLFSIAPGTGVLVFANEGLVLG